MKKKLIIIFSSLLLALVLLTAGYFIFLNSRTLINVCKDGRWGYVSKSNKTIISFDYDWAGEFKNGLAIALKGPKYGVINKRGKTVIPFKYNEILSSDNKTFLVLAGQKFKFINKRGKVLSDGFQAAKPYEDGLAAVRIKGKWGYIDKKEKVVIPAVFEEAQSLINGMAVTRYNGVYGVMNKKAKNIVPFRYSFVEPAQKNKFVACTLIDDFGVIKNCGVIDEKENVIIPLNNMEVKYVQKDTYAIKDNDLKWHFVDSDGKTKFDDSFEVVNVFENGYAAVCKTSYQCGVIDKKGNEIIKPEFLAISGYKNGLFAAMQDGKWGFINKKGKVIIPFEYDWTGYIY